MNQDYYKLKYLKYKAKYYGLVEQRGSSYSQNPWRKENFPPPDMDGNIHTDPSQPLDILPESERIKYEQKWDREQQMRQQQEQQMRQQQMHQQQNSTGVTFPNPTNDYDHYFNQRM